MINDCNILSEYDLTWKTHSMLKSLNWNIIDEYIIITLKTNHRKVKSNHLELFKYLENHDMLLDDHNNKTIVRN